MAKNLTKHEPLDFNMQAIQSGSPETDHSPIELLQPSNHNS